MAVDTDTAPVQATSYRGTVARLAGAQKPKHGPAYTVHVNRLFGRRVAAVAHLLGASPNQVTVVSSMITFTGVALVAAGASHPAVAVGAALLLAAGFAFDAADGQLARLTGGGSLAGEWLDHVVDAVKIVALHSAVLIHLHRATDVADGWLLVPLGYSAVGVGTFSVMLLSDLLNRSAGVAPSGSPDSSLARRLMLLPVDYGVLCSAFLLLAMPDAFLVVYGALFAAAAAHFVISSSRRFRELLALDSRR